MIMDKKYYPGLDLLRIIGAVAVAYFFHYKIVLGTSPFKGTIVGDFLNTYGGYAVELFFVISGFVMWHAYSNRIREGKVRFGKYVIDRIIRLYPQVIIAVVVIVIIMQIGYAIYGEPLTDNANISPLAIVLNILGLNGGTLAEAGGMSVNGPTWYVSVLMVCYILYYAIIKLCRGSRIAESVCFAIMIIIGIVLIYHPLQIPFLLMSSGRGYMFFFAGIFAAKLQQLLSGKWPALTRRRLLNLMCDNKVVKFLGNISYGIFIWNMPVFITALLVDRLMGETLSFRNLLTYIIIIGVNTAVGAVSHILIDKKLVAVLRKAVNR